MESETLCFECGQTAGNPPILNRHEDGSTCRRCADRVLAYLPPALPGQPNGEQSPSDYEYDLPGSDLEFDDGDDRA
ncbi:MAG: hypothetical protein AAFZ65_18735 [Planctomycetota bacterium]